MNPVTPGPTHPFDPDKWRGTESDTPVAVPPDQAPLRDQGDLLGTLKTLQRYFGEFWTLIDADAISEGQRHSDSGTVAQLIATAIAQAEALRQPNAGLRPCAKCGGRPAEHRYRMGDGEWCVCNESCECDGYVAEEGAEK